MAFMYEKVRCKKCGHKYEKDPSNLKIRCPKCDSFDSEAIKIGDVDLRVFKDKRWGK